MYYLQEMLQQHKVEPNFYKNFFLFFPAINFSNLDANICGIASINFFLEGNS